MPKEMISSSQEKDRLFRVLDLSHDAIQAFIDIEEEVSNDQMILTRIRIERILMKTCDDIIAEIMKLTE